jgi:hypothetical protein
MNAQPIYEAEEVTPYTGITCRAWLADGSEYVATMSGGRWMCTTEPEDLHPVRWQRLVPKHGTCGWPGMEPLQIPGPMPQWVD